MARKQGFTLLEMSIVLIIISVILGGGAVIFASSLQRKQYDDTVGKLKFIQQKLLDYRRAYNRLPCPADLTNYAMENASGYFGVEAQYTGQCTGTPSAAYFYGNSAVGMVPTKTLRLPDDFAIDGWGHRIDYIVDKNYTGTDAFTTTPITDTVTRITINSSGGQLITNYAAYALLSLGSNGHGAYSRGSGNTTPQRINAGSTNTDELANCICTATGVNNPAPALNGAGNLILIQHIPTQNSTNVHDSFDDILVYATRKDLRSALE